MTLDPAAKPSFYPAYLSVGSNLGDRGKNIAAAVQLLQPAGNITALSPVYETAAWGNEDQPAFYNIALCLQTELSPLALLDVLLETEKNIGRVRHEKWARIIDIDLIFYGSEIIHLENRLIVPHPEMQRRKFVLVPLADIAPGFIHPQLRKTVNELLKELKDDLEVRKIKDPGFTT